MYLAHSCSRNHWWGVRCDVSEDGFMYIDPIAAVCVVCDEVGAAQHYHQMAYRICPACMSHYYVLLEATAWGMRLPDLFPMYCMSCSNSHDGVHSLVELARKRTKLGNESTRLKEVNVTDNSPT